MSTITIFENGVYVGDGELRQTANGQQYVSDCPADLGCNSAEAEGAYESIDEALNAGAAYAMAAGNRYTWTIDEGQP